MNHHEPLQKLESEITLVLSEHARRTPYQEAGQSLLRRNIAVPVLRKLEKDGFSFSRLSLKEQYCIWKSLYFQTRSFEVMSLALYFNQRVRATRCELESLVEFVSRVECWEHSDDLSKILARGTEDFPGLMVPILRSWNTHPNPWYRRQSIVGLMEYASARQSYLDFDVYVELIRQLLKDQDYYVQKAVGWQLRELTNVYPKQAREWLEQHLPDISSIAFSAACEKIPPQIREQWKQRRREYRNQKRKVSS